MASSLFGWDLLIKSVEAEIKSNDDILLCFTHLVLISNGFKCIGLGESKNIDGTETKTETLPEGWTTATALRYVFQGRLYILKCTKLDDGIMINLLRIDERTTSLVQLNSNSVASRTGSLDQMLPKHSELINLVKAQLIDKVVVSKKNREVSSQTEATTTTPTASNQPEPGHLPPVFRPIDPLGVPLRRPNVGEFDLDPFAGRNPLGIAPPMSGGGMLFEPPRGPQYPHGPSFGLPPGAIPPGARFDPFRPPDVDRMPRRGNRPDNDEMLPPGYDDMFM